MCKRYLVVDLNSDFKEEMEYKDLKRLLIDVIVEDLLMNCGEYEVVKSCTEDLEKLAREDFTSEKWIIENLLSYSYKVIDLYDLQRDLEDCKQYFSNENEFNIIIEKINKGAK